MDTNNIFICYSKTGEELLLYRENRTTFHNLLSNNNMIYPIKNIDFSTIVFASSFLRLKNYMTLETIKNKYLKDRAKMVRTQNYIVGCITEIKNLQERYIGSAFDLRRHYRWESNPKYHSLFIPTISVFQRDKSYKIYRNVLNNQKYISFTGEDFSKNFILNNGIEYVELFSKNLEDISNKSICDKKFVYEAANQLKQKSLIMYK